MTRFFLLSVLFSCFLVSNAESSSAILSKALRHYEAKSYDSVIVLIRSHLTAHGKDPEAEYLVPLIMEAFLRKGDHASVNRLFDLYRQKFSSSDFMPRVHYLHGYALIKQRSLDAGLSAFSEALTGGVSSDLDSLIRLGTEALCANALDPNQLSAVAGRRDLHATIREIARRHATSESRTALREPPRNHKRSTGLTHAPKDGIAIGLLAPLSGEDGDIGKRLALGVQLAADRHNGANRKGVRIIPFDTKGSLIETAHRTKTLLTEEKVAAVIGPVLSPTATVAAALISNEDAVMLSPTATDDGIAGLGPNIFQMNLTIGVLARAAARYALDNLNIREFAIVAPNSADGAAMSAAFRKEVTQSGGEIVDEQAFEEGGNDFTPQFTALRRALLLRRLTEEARRRGDSRPATRISAADSTRWADSSLSIGAIFMPAETDDAVMLAPQVFFNRIKGQLIGSSGWHAKKTVTEGKQYVQNAIIATVPDPDPSWKKWASFRKEYLARYGEEPDRVAALGFDAGTLVMMAVTTRNAAAALSAVTEFEGASGMVSFDSQSRSNTKAVILKITRNGFARVK